MLKNQATSATSEKDNDDEQSDKGTYTIELENPNSEEVEARKMIDKVNNKNWGTVFSFGVLDFWKLLEGQHAMYSCSQCWNFRISLRNCKTNKTEMLSEFILFTF